MHESGASAMPIQEELVKEIVSSQQLHIDETIMDGTHDFFMAMGFQYRVSDCLLDCHKVIRTHRKYLRPGVLRLANE